MTYLLTHQGFAYLAVVIDVFSRKVVGWAFANQMTAELVVRALDMALFTRKPQAVIHHSDQGSPVHQHGVRPALHANGRAAQHGQCGRRLR